MKYLFFDSSWKMQAYCRGLCVCVCVCVCVCARYSNAGLVDAWCDFARCASRCRSLTPGPLADSQIDNVTLYRPLPLHSAPLKPPAAGWLTERARPLTSALASLKFHFWCLLKNLLGVDLIFENLICCTGFVDLDSDKTHTLERKRSVSSATLSLQHEQISVQKKTENCPFLMIYHYYMIKINRQLVKVLLQCFIIAVNVLVDTTKSQ